jgi:pimeloyl-ACP methyl ester carboxylesterase
MRASRRNKKGDVRTRYEETGSGFPLLVTPGGGLNSRVNNWPTAVFNAMEIFKDEFRCITMDQRNANGGESTGPIPTSDPWNAFADDQIGLMDHLGIGQFLFMGYCIGGCFALKLMERVVGGVLVQTVGHHPDHPDYMYNAVRDAWAPELLSRRPDLAMAQVEQYLHDLYRARPEFVYSVSRDFARSCQTPMLVLPDETPGPSACVFCRGCFTLPERRDHGVPMARDPMVDGSEGICAHGRSFGPSIRVVRAMGTP